MFRMKAKRFLIRLAFSRVLIMLDTEALPAGVGVGHIMAVALAWKSHRHEHSRQFSRLRAVQMITTEWLSPAKVLKVYV